MQVVLEAEVSEQLLASWPISCKARDATLSSKRSLSSIFSHGEQPEALAVSQMQALADQSVQQPPVVV